MDDIKKLIIEKKRRLQKLKEREAKFGINTPPEILTEIEDLEKGIGYLQEELEVLMPSVSSQSNIKPSKNASNVRNRSKSSWLFPTGFILMGLLFVCVLAVCVSPAIGFGSIFSGISSSPPTNVASTTLQEPSESEDSSLEIIPTPSAPTSTPEPVVVISTFTPVPPTDIPVVPTTRPDNPTPNSETPTTQLEFLGNLPWRWEGTYNWYRGGRTIEWILIIEEMQGNTFLGQFRTPDFGNNIAKIRAEFTRDLSDIDFVEESRWDYIDGFDTVEDGIWLKFTELEKLQGTKSVAVGSWQYAHLQDDGVLQGVRFGPDESEPRGDFLLTQIR